MAVIVVGGQSKHVGKTTLICHIISSLRTSAWIAAKLTTHSHRPADCELIQAADEWSIWEQHLSHSQSDTARFLAAGAQRAFLLQAEQLQIRKATAALAEQLSPLTNLIVESSGAAEFLNPDLSIVVIDEESVEMKNSAKRQLSISGTLIVPKRNVEALRLSAIAVQPATKSGGAPSEYVDLMHAIQQKLRP